MFLTTQIQHIPEGSSGDGGEEDRTRQVILILPEKVGEHPGDVAALLPSLGLTSSPADCVSIAAVHPKHHQHHLHHQGQQVNSQPLVYCQNFFFFSSLSLFHLLFATSVVLGIKTLA